MLRRERASRKAHTPGAKRNWFSSNVQRPVVLLVSKSTMCYAQAYESISEGLVARRLIERGKHQASNLELNLTSDVSVDYKKLFGTEDRQEKKSPKTLYLTAKVITRKCDSDTQEVSGIKVYTGGFCKHSSRKKASNHIKTLPAGQRIHEEDSLAR